MQIFVSGTWKAERAGAYAAEAVRLGSLLAASGADLTCGPGTGIAAYVIDAYRAARPGGKVRFYLPRAQDMSAAGEGVERESDETVLTELDYPMRNIAQVRASDGLFVLTGGDGALGEILAAVADYGTPVAVVEGSGSAADAARLLVGVFPDWEALMMFGPTVDALFDRFMSAVRARTSSGAPRIATGGVGLP